MNHLALTTAIRPFPLLLHLGSNSILLVIMVFTCIYVINKENTLKFVCMHAVHLVLNIAI